MDTPVKSVEQPLPLSPHGNLSKNWLQWKENFNNYLANLKVAPTDNEACPLFLHQIGPYGREIFFEFNLSIPYTLEQVYKEFDDYCSAKKNVMLDRYIFFSTKQETNQSFDEFFSLLQERSSNCSFGELTDSLIGSQIIIGTNDAVLKKRLLALPTLSLDRIVQTCRSISSDKFNCPAVDTSSTELDEKRDNGEDIADKKRVLMMQDLTLNDIIRKIISREPDKFQTSQIKGTTIVGLLQSTTQLIRKSEQHIESSASKDELELSSTINNEICNISITPQISELVTCKMCGLNHAMTEVCPARGWGLS